LGGWGSSTSSSTTHGMLVGSLLPSFLLSCFPRPLVRPLDDPDLYTAIGNLSLHLYPCSFCRRLVGLRHRSDPTQPVFVGAGGLRRRRARAAPSSALMCVHDACSGTVRLFSNNPVFFNTTLCERADERSINTTASPQSPPPPPPSAAATIRAPVTSA
jgi:hypothetical protein